MDSRGLRPGVAAHPRPSSRLPSIGAVRWLLAVLLMLTVVLTPGVARAADGDFEWARAMGGAVADQGFDVAVDSSGNVHTTGAFQGTADFDPGAGVANLVSNGATDIFVQKLDTNGNFLWAVGIGGTLQDQGRGIAVDGSGNVYVTGFFRGTVDFDPGPGVANLTNVGPFTDIFVLKLDANGNFVWARSMVGLFIDAALDIAVDASGNVHTTGFFQGTVDFNPAPGAAIFPLTSTGAFDIFVQKLDTNGVFVWARSMGGAFLDSGLSIAVDGSGNVHTTGFFQGTVDFNPGLGVFPLTSNGAFDIFVQKLNPNGVFVWARSMGGVFLDAGLGVVVDSIGNVYTTGIFAGTVDFNPLLGFSFLTSNGSFDIFVQKLNPNGVFVWARSMGGPQADVGTDIAIDDDGDIYTTGAFQGTVDFDPGAGTAFLTSNGESDIFVHKLDTNGGFIWAKAMGGSEADSGAGIAVDDQSNVYTTGSFSDTVDFDPGPGVFNLTSAGSNDIFVQKLAGPPPTAIDLVAFEATGDEGGVHLTWETGSEIDNAGFNLYRATAAHGPFARVNDALIPARGENVSGGSYTYTDFPGPGTFFYRLEDVDTRGISTFHGPLAVEAGSQGAGIDFSHQIYLPTLQR